MPNKENTPRFQQLHLDVVTHILQSKGFSPEKERQAAFDNAGLSDPLKTLVDKVAHHAHKITDSDIEAVKAAGVSEDQIFELVICAAVGEASRHYTNGLNALAEAVSDKKGGYHVS